MGHFRKSRYECRVIYTYERPSVNLTLFISGCYPQCPKNKPFFDEETMTCVSNCGCYEDGKNYKPGMEMPSKQNCESW